MNKLTYCIPLYLVFRYLFPESRLEEVPVDNFYPNFGLLPALLLLYYFLN